MRVALLGAPTAGKTDIAKRIARALNRDLIKHPDNRPNRWVVIDGYVEKLSQRTGAIYGRQAGYVQNFQVLFERLTLENEAQLKGYHTISCGSVYDTITYAALLNVVPPRDEQELLFQTRVTSSFMNCLALIEPTLAYDHLFFVPWQKREHEHSWDAVINAKLPEVLSSLGRTATALTGSRKQQVQDALAVTRFIRDNVYTSSVEGSVVDDE